MTVTHENGSASEDATGNPSLYCPSARTCRCSGTLATAAAAVDFDALVLAAADAAAGVLLADEGGGGGLTRAADAGVTATESGSRSGVVCADEPSSLCVSGPGDTGCGVTRSA